MGQEFVSQSKRGGELRHSREGKSCTKTRKHETAWCFSDNEAVLYSWKGIGWDMEKKARNVPKSKGDLHILRATVLSCLKYILSVLCPCCSHIPLPFS